MSTAINGDNVPHEPYGSRVSSSSGATDTGPHSDSTHYSDGSDTSPHSDSINDNDGSDTGSHSDSDSDGSDTVVPSHSTSDNDVSDTGSHSDSDSDESDTARARAPSGTLSLVVSAAKSLDNLLSVFRDQHQNTAAALRKIRQAFQASLIVEGFNISTLDYDGIDDQLLEQMDLLQEQNRAIDIARESLRQELMLALSPSWVDRIFPNTTSTSGHGLNSPPLTGHQAISTTKEAPTDNNTTTSAEVPTGNIIIAPAEALTDTDHNTTTPAEVPTVTDKHTAAPGEVLTGDNTANPLGVPTVTNSIATTPTQSDTFNIDTLSDSSVPSKKRRRGL